MVYMARVYLLLDMVYMALPAILALRVLSPEQLEPGLEFSGRHNQQADMVYTAMPVQPQEQTLESMEKLFHLKVVV